MTGLGGRPVDGRRGAGSGSSGLLGRELAPGVHEAIRARTEALVASIGESLGASSAAVGGGAHAGFRPLRYERELGRGLFLSLRRDPE